jgi:hypothetical protein
MPADSCQHNFLSFRLRIEPEHFFAFGFQQELNGILEVGQTFLLGFAMSVRAGNLQASGPKTAFFRLAMVDDSREVFHAYILAGAPHSSPLFSHRRYDNRTLAAAHIAFQMDDLLPDSERWLPFGNGNGEGRA